MIRLCFAFLLVSILAGCEAPATAPSEYESILGFLFEHMEDESDEELTQGLENLYDWLSVPENFSAASEGYQIRNLGESGVSQLDDRERSAAGLRGVSTVTKSPLAPEVIAGTLTWDGFGEIVEGNYSLYEREFDSDSSCFVERECSFVAASSHTISKWVVVEMDTRYRIQYRWVRTKYGWMMLHRFWLLEPASAAFLTMNANYYLGVLFADGARGGGDLSPAFRNTGGGLIGGASSDLAELKSVLECPGSLRIHANWFDADTGQVPLEENQILEFLLNNTKTDAQRIDDWVSANPQRTETFLPEAVQSRLTSEQSECTAETPMEVEQ